MASSFRIKQHFAPMIRDTMETPAWRALSSTSQSLYVWLKLEWKGAANNNNGKIQFSNRQASNCLGVSINTASRAFHDLQAKGFIVVTKAAILGVGGDAKSACYEVTEMSIPQNDKHKPRQLYKNWKPEQEFPVHKSMANNPTGRNGRLETNDVVINFNARLASINRTQEN